MSGIATAPVQQTLFSLDDCPLTRRFECWRHSVAGFCDVDAARDVAGDFHATIDSHVVGSFLLSRTRAGRQRWIRTSRTIAGDGTDHYMVLLLESGEQTVRIGGQDRSMKAGQLIICDLQRPMAVQVSDFQTLSIMVPRSLLAPRLEHPDAVHGLIVDDAVPIATLLRSHLKTLKVVAGDLSAKDVQKVTVATVGMIAACVNGVGRAGLAKPAARPLPLLPRIKRYILDNLHDPALRPEPIARRQGVSRSKLYQMFEAEGGVLAYIRDARLKAAFDALCDPCQASRSIYDIALEAGYHSDASFCRAFKSMFEVTPSTVRRSAAAATGAHAPVAAGTDRRYEVWLRNLTESGPVRVAIGTAGPPVSWPTADRHMLQRRGDGPARLDRACAAVPAPHRQDCRLSHRATGTDG